MLVIGGFFAKTCRGSMSSVNGWWASARACAWPLENADSAPWEAIDKVSFDLGVTPWRVCGSQIGHMRRPRLHWGPFPLAEPRVERLTWLDVPLEATPPHRPRSSSRDLP